MCFEGPCSRETFELCLHSRCRRLVHSLCTMRYFPTMSFVSVKDIIIIIMITAIRKTDIGLDSIWTQYGTKFVSNFIFEFDSRTNWDFIRSNWREISKFTIEVDASSCIALDVMEANCFAMAFCTRHRCPEDPEDQRNHCRRNECISILVNAVDASNAPDECCTMQFSFVISFVLFF